MTAIVLKIKWQYSTEYIPFQLSGMTEEGSVETVEKVNDADELFSYRASYKYECDSNGVHRLALRYTPEDNEALARSQTVDFGLSRITISADLKKRAATWESEGDRAGSSGDAKSCDIVDVDTGEQRAIARNERSAIARPDQPRLRALLLLLDGECAISGEKTALALEAAHINPVAGRGIDTIGNAILLRADLHRLYDGGAFTIEPDGTLLPLPDLGDDYRALLQRQPLAARLMRRIGVNLAQRKPSP